MGQLETMQQEIQQLKEEVAKLAQAGRSGGGYGFGDAHALAKFLGVSYSTVKRNAKNYPRYRQLGKYYYDFKEVADYLKRDGLSLLNFKTKPL